MRNLGQSSPRCRGNKKHAATQWADPFRPMRSAPFAPIPRTRRLTIAFGAVLATGLTTPVRAEPAAVETASAQGPTPGQFVQTDGQIVDADEAYQRLHATGEPKPLRAALEMGIMLGAGTSWYWVTREDNARDWDATDLAGRLNGRDWRIDNNSLAVNFFYHALSGTAYYGVARANHLSMPVAYAYAFTSSFLWDFALEYNERVSISDVLVTPSAGLVFAEYLHKLSWYLNSVPARPSTRQSVLRWTPIGASVALHRAWDGQDHPVVHHTDNLGYDADLYHRFAFD